MKANLEYIYLIFLFLHMFIALSTTDKIINAIHFSIKKNLLSQFKISSWLSHKISWINYHDTLINFSNLRFKLRTKNIQEDIVYDSTMICIKRYVNSRERGCNEDLIALETHCLGFEEKFEISIHAKLYRKAR